jgi:uncharacterized membrane protein YfcA
MILDHINAGFEAAGALVRVLDCLKLYKSKKVVGVHPASTLFFFSWGVWNTVFFTGIHQPWSLVCSIMLCSMNAFWLGLAFVYRKNYA